MAAARPSSSPRLRAGRLVMAALGAVAAGWVVGRSLRWILRPLMKMWPFGRPAGVVDKTTGSHYPVVECVAVVVVAVIGRIKHLILLSVMVWA
jgi:hypothetical protein